MCVSSVLIRMYKYFEPQRPFSAQLRQMIQCFMRLHLSHPKLDIPLWAEGSQDLSPENHSSTKHIVGICELMYAEECGQSFPLRRMSCDKMWLTPCVSEVTRA